MSEERRDKSGKEVGGGGASAIQRGVKGAVSRRGHPPLPDNNARRSRDAEAGNFLMRAEVAGCCAPLRGCRHCGPSKAFPDAQI